MTWLSLSRPTCRTRIVFQTWCRPTSRSLWAKPKRLSSAFAKNIKQQVSLVSMELYNKCNKGVLPRYVLFYNGPPTFSHQKFCTAALLYSMDATLIHCCRRCYPLSYKNCSVKELHLVGPSSDSPNLLQKNNADSLSTPYSVHLACCVDNVDWLPLFARP